MKLNKHLKKKTPLKRRDTEKLYQQTYFETCFGNGKISALKGCSSLGYEVTSSKIQSVLNSIDQLSMFLCLQYVKLNLL